MDTQGVPILRRMEISDVIDAAIGLYRRNFGLILGTAAVVFVPIMGVQAVLSVRFFSALIGAKGDQIPTVPVLLNVSGLLGVSLLGLVLYPMGEAACCVVVSELYLGRRVSVREAYRRVWPVLPRLLLTYALVGVFVGGVTLAATAVTCFVGFLPALYWSMVVLLFAWPIVVLEGIWGPDALRRSYDLVSGHFWRILGTWLLLNLAISAVVYMTVLPIQYLCMLFMGDTNSLQAQMTANSIGQMLSLLVRPITIIAVVLLYYDVRIRKEGFDLQVMAAALGHDTTVYAPTAKVAPDVPLFGLPTGVALPPRPGEEPASATAGDDPPTPEPLQAADPPESPAQAVQDAPQQGIEADDAGSSDSHTAY